MTKQKIKKPNPPYIGGNKLKQLLNLFSSRSFSRIDISDLTDRGFSKSEAYQAFQALRFLGLVDDDGNTTDNTKKLGMKGQKREDTLQDIVKSSYNKLFKIVPEPYSLTRDELHNEFMAIYGLSNRMARSTTPAFLWISEEASLIKVRKKPKKKKSIPGKVGIHSITESPKDKPQEVKPVMGFNEMPFKKGVKLLIPKSLNMTKMILSEEFKELILKLEKCLDGISQDKSSGNGGSESKNA